MNLTTFKSYDAERLLVEPLLDLGGDFIVVGVSAELLLREDQLAVYGHLKQASVGWDEGNRLDGPAKFVDELLRQPGGAWCVVSNLAELNLHVHVRILLMLHPIRGVM